VRDGFALDKLHGLDPEKFLVKLYTIVYIADVERYMRLKGFN
jgi:hypothetical protein